MKITLSEQNYLKFTKFFILGLVIIFVISPGKYQFWPFIYWELFDAGNPYIPKERKLIEFRVLDTNQNWHIIRPMDLYSIDDDVSDQPGSLVIARKIVQKNGEFTDIYHSYLIKHLERKLNFKIEKIEAYRSTWKLDYNQYPPLDINQPDKMEKIDSFQASDYIN
ncbi:hypothetical protein [Crocosphaera subtropica]|nr:hypothetical protein [Crocosphaera subtropica]